MSVCVQRIVFYLFIFNFVFIVTGQGFKQERGGRAGGVVFKPILGKRMYGESNKDSLLRMLEAADTLKYYYDQLPYYEQQADEGEKVTKKVIFTPKLGRSLEDQLFEDKRAYDVDFTPRLGRRIPEEAGVTSSDEELYRADSNQIDGRNKFFSPRLGRTVKLTPRLGRDYPYEMYPSKVRLARSTNATKNT